MEMTASLHDHFHCQTQKREKLLAGTQQAFWANQAHHVLVQCHCTSLTSEVGYYALHVSWLPTKEGNTICDVKGLSGSQLCTEQQKNNSIAMQGLCQICRLLPVKKKNKKKLEHSPATLSDCQPFGIVRQNRKFDGELRHELGVLSSWPAFNLQ